MDAPAVFNLSIVPKGYTADAGGIRMKTGSEYLDTHRFTRSEDPALAKMFLAGQNAVAELYKLGYSNQTLLNIERGAVEYSELTIPQGSLARHLISHLQSLSAIADQLAQMPDADRVKLERVVPPRPTGKIVFAVVVIVAVCAGIAVLAKFEHDKIMSAAVAGFDGAPQGIPASEAALIPNLKGWRLAGSPDYDPDLVQWLAKSGIQPAGRVDGDFIGGGEGNDHAYLLINSEGTRRVVVVAGGQPKFDETFPRVALMARVPSATIRGVKLEYGSRATGTSDGILVVRDKNNAGSGLIISFNSGSLITGVPQNYQSTLLH
jgi:hypothetical protein